MFEYQECTGYIVDRCVVGNFYAVYINGYGEQDINNNNYYYNYHYYYYY